MRPFHQKLCNIPATREVNSQGVKLRLIQAPMQLCTAMHFGDQILKISRQIGDWNVSS